MPDRPADRTIERFGDQWSRYPSSEGWYGSVDLLYDILSPLIHADELRHLDVVEIGSGAGRIVGMMLAAGVRHIYAVEPSSKACTVLERNVKAAGVSERVTIVNARGDAWSAARPVDLAVSIGVLHHIPHPLPVVSAVLANLKAGGRFFVWLYGYEGNERYVSSLTLLRTITTRLPHVLLVPIVWLLYGALVVYAWVPASSSLPLKQYVERVLWPMTPAHRRLVIYDQLNPSYAKYYREAEARRLLEDAGFVDVRLHHRHGYSWSVVGTKPSAPTCTSDHQGAGAP